MKSPVLLIDLSALFRAAWHVIPSDGSPNVAYESTLSAVNRCVNMTRERFKLQSHERLNVAVCCDGKGNWRKAISPEYKAHREAQPASMYGMLDRVKDTLRKDAFLLWECEGYEADDIIGAAADGIAALDGFGDAPEESTNVVIASHDKDLCQLSSPSVLMLKTHTWDFADMADIVSKFGVKPFQIVDYLALMGDKSDNVEGCPGVGDKTASSLIGRYGTIEKLYEYIESAPVHTDPLWRTSNGKSPLAILDKLYNAKEKVLLAKQLVRLKYDAPIDINEIFLERVPQKRVDSGAKFDDSDFDLPEEKEKEDMSELENRVFGLKDPESQTLPLVTGRVVCPACEQNECVCKVPVGTSPAVSIPFSSEVNTSAEAVHASAEPETAKVVSPSSPVAYNNTSTGSYIEARSVPLQTPGKDINPQKETTLTIVPAEYERQLEPRNTGGAVAMGELLFNSGLFKKYPNPQSCTAAIVLGREIGGFGALQSMGLFDVVQGAVTLKSHTIIHLGMTNPEVEYMYCSHTDDKYAEYTIRLKKWPVGKERTHRFTIEEAVQSGYTELVMTPKNMTRDAKGNLPRDDRNQWDKMRAAMLRKTAGAQCVRIYLPGAGLGLTSYEEMGGQE